MAHARGTGVVETKTRKIMEARNEYKRIMETDGKVKTFVKGSLNNWTRHESKKIRGKFFFYNNLTRETKWEKEDGEQLAGIQTGRDRITAIPTAKTLSGGRPVHEKPAESRAVGKNAVGSRPVGNKSAGSIAVGDKSVGSRGVWERSVGSRATWDKSVGRGAAWDKSVKSVGRGAAWDKSVKSLGRGAAWDKSVKSVGRGAAWDKSVKSVGRGAAWDKSVKSVGRGAAWDKSVGSRATWDKSVGSRVAWDKSVGSRAIGEKFVGSRTVGENSTGSRTVGEKLLGRSVIGKPTDKVFVEKPARDAAFGLKQSGGKVIGVHPTCVKSKPSKTTALDSIRLHYTAGKKDDSKVDKTVITGNLEKLKDQIYPAKIGKRNLAQTETKTKQRTVTSIVATPGPQISNNPGQNKEKPKDFHAGQKRMRDADAKSDLDENCHKKSKFGSESRTLHGLKKGSPSNIMLKENQTLFKMSKPEIAAQKDLYEALAPKQTPYSIEKRPSQATPETQCKASINIPELRDCTQPHNQDMSQCEAMDVDDRSLHVIEDVYMRPVFNELDLNEEISFIDSKSELKSEMSCSLIQVVLDTCVLISNLQDLCKFVSDHQLFLHSRIFLPWVVLQELDGLKDGKAKSSTLALREKARHAIAAINKWLTDPKYIDVVVLENGLDSKCRTRHLEVETNDDKILNTAIDLSKAFKVLLVSNDINLRNKAMANHIKACPFKDTLRTVKVMIESQALEKHEVPKCNPILAADITKTPLPDPSIISASSLKSNPTPDNFLVSPGLTDQSEHQKDMSLTFELIKRFYISNFKEDKCLQIHAEFLVSFLSTFSFILQYEFIEAYGVDLWMEIVKHKPDQSAKPYLWGSLCLLSQCYEKHWIAVFILYRKDTKDLIESIFNYFKQPLEPFKTSDNEWISSSVEKLKTNLRLYRAVIEDFLQKRQYVVLKRIKERMTHLLSSFEKDDASAPSALPISPDVVFTVFNDIWMALFQVVAKIKSNQNSRRLFASLRHTMTELRTHLESFLSSFEPNHNQTSLSPQLKCASQKLCAVLLSVPSFLLLISLTWPEIADCLDPLKNAPLYFINPDRLLSYVSASKDNIQIVSRGAEQLNEFICQIMI